MDFLTPGCNVLYHQNEFLFLPGPIAGTYFTASITFRGSHGMRVSSKFHFQARLIKICAILHFLSSPLSWWHTEHLAVDSKALGNYGATIWKEPGFLNDSKEQSAASENHVLSQSRKENILREPHVGGCGMVRF